MVLSIFGKEGMSFLWFVKKILVVPAGMWPSPCRHRTENCCSVTSSKSMPSHPVKRRLFTVFDRRSPPATIYFYVNTKLKNSYRVLYRTAMKQHETAVRKGIQKPFHHGLFWWWTLTFRAVVWPDEHRGSSRFTEDVLSNFIQFRCQFFIRQHHWAGNPTGVKYHNRPTLFTKCLMSFDLSGRYVATLRFQYMYISYYLIRQPLDFPMCGKVVIRIKLAIKDRMFAHIFIHQVW